MKHFFRDQAIVLRKRPLGEKDEFVLLLTQHYGKRGFMSYGSRDPRSRKSGLLELCNEIAFEAREGKGMPVLQQVKLLQSRGLPLVDHHQELDGFYRATELLKLTDRLIQDDQNVQSVYQDLTQALSSLADESVVEVFWIRLLDDLGFLSDWKHCSACGEPFQEGQSFVFSLEHRGFDHEACFQGKAESVSLELFKVMNYVQKSSLESAMRLQVKPRRLRQIRSFLDQLAVEY